MCLLKLKDSLIEGDFSACKVLLPNGTDILLADVMVLDVTHRKVAQRHQLQHCTPAETQALQKPTCGNEHEVIVAMLDAAGEADSGIS